MRLEPSRLKIIDYTPVDGWFGIIYVIPIYYNQHGYHLYLQWTSPPTFPAI